MREWSVASVLRWREWPHEMQKLKFMMREWPVCLERGFPEKGWKVTSSTILHPLLLWFWAITTQRDWQSSLLHNRCKLRRWTCSDAFTPRLHNPTFCTTGAKENCEHALMLLLLTRLLTAEGISQKASVGLSRTSIIAAFQPWIGQNQPALNITDSSSTAQQIEAVLAKSMSWFWNYRFMSPS